MKAKLFLVALLGLFLLAGCSKDDNELLEINPDSTVKVLEKSEDGISFKFYLEDEDGNPATVFEEGKDFVFNFIIKNNTGKNLLYQRPFLNDNLFRIYRVSDNEDMGKSWTGYKETFEMCYAYYMTAGQEILYDCSWLNNNASHFLSIEDKNQSLPAGEYYTIVSVNFPYMIAKESDYTGTGWDASLAENIRNISLRIFFKIK